MFGLVLLEAMSYSLPIIASNGGACPEVLDGAGLLFAPNDSNELAEKILVLIGDEDLRKDLRKKSLLRVKNFEWNKSAKQYLEIYMKYARIRE